MTDEELAKEFRHIHDRFDYLMGQVESISKSDLFAAVEKTAKTVNRAVRKFASINAHLESIDKRLNKDLADMSAWEMLHAGAGEA